MKPKYDVVILGAGHNGLVAAAYLARAGLSVLLLEKNDYIGGATTSQKLFPDYDARLSRYSYLVSMLPEKIIRELGLNIELRSRNTASFTPYQRNGAQRGLLLSNVSESVSRASVHELTGTTIEFEQLKEFYGLARIFVEFFREPDPQLGYLFGGWLTMGMVLSVPMVLIGLWAALTARRAAEPGRRILVHSWHLGLSLRLAKAAAICQRTIFPRRFGRQHVGILGRST